MKKNEAGRFEGTFEVKRSLSGDKFYRKGDERKGRVSDLSHLLESGAIHAADKDTADAAAAYLGCDVTVGETPDPAPADGSITPIAPAEKVDPEPKKDPPKKSAKKGPPAATMKQTEKKLRKIAADEKVEVLASDDKKALVAKIATARATPSTKAEGSAKDKAEANDTKTKS